MQQTQTEFIGKIIQNKKKIESGLKVKIENKGKVIFINGKAEAEFTAVQVINAINLGFSVERALLLKNEKMLLQTLNIKDITKRHNLDEIRGRIIGTKGRTLKTLAKLTNCFIALKDNQIGIIGDAEEIDDAIQAITSLIQGSQQGNVYGRLEREKKAKKIQREFRGE